MSVTLSSRCCSAWSRATSTRCCSVWIRCSWAILSLIAWTTCGGGWRFRRKNAVTWATLNGAVPSGGLVVSAESTSASIVAAMRLRSAMSLME